MKSVNLYQIPFEDLFRIIRNDAPAYEYDYSRHCIEIADDKGSELASLRLPLHLSIDPELNIGSLNAGILYLSIESGSAAVILKEGKTTLFHKTISAYMTRKKQGFSQIKYLNKKGKSRAGSRVRLAATTVFFESINTLTTELLKEHQVTRIALNCNKTLLPYLFQSKIAAPFEKKDSRLYKIPVHIQKSNTSQLEATIKKLFAPILTYREDAQEALASILRKLDDQRV